MGNTQLEYRICYEWGHGGWKSNKSTGEITLVHPCNIMLKASASSMKKVPLFLILDNEKCMFSEYFTEQYVYQCAAAQPIGAILIGHTQTLTKEAFMEELKKYSFFEKAEIKRQFRSYMQMAADDYIRYALETSHAFISYSSSDRKIADMLCNILEAEGINTWYAPRNVSGDFAASIAEAISKTNIFIVLQSRSSYRSQHVLNEVALAFQRYNTNTHNIKIKPLRIDNTSVPTTSAFAYYLSRQHQYEANPPTEYFLRQFAKSIKDEIIRPPTR